jgi:hypothetical protein
MSSEISIEAEGRVTTAAHALDASVDKGFQPWHFFVLASILLATVAVILARQSSPAHLILISFTIAAAGAAAGAFYRMLVPLTAPVVVRTGEPVSERTRAALEREKMLVLRTIKELEFDRSMGKLSQRDFDEMAGRLRARAVSLMKQLDLGAAGYKAAIETELARRVWGSGGSGRASDRGERSEALAPSCACGTTNDVDALFCKQCGARLQAQGATARNARFWRSRSCHCWRLAPARRCRIPKRCRACRCPRATSPQARSRSGRSCMLVAERSHAHHDAAAVVVRL